MGKRVLEHIERLRSGDIDAALLKELSKVKLLTPAIANAKTAKGLGKGYAPYIMHLAPSKLSGYNMCPAASKGCAAACLNTAGRGKFDSIQQSRVRKTLYFVKARQEFLWHLFEEIRKLERKAIRDGLKLVIRLNGTSDIPWESLKVMGRNVFDSFPCIQFYDYTKALGRLEVNRPDLPNNYHITFSASESNEFSWQTAIKYGYNVAMVFDQIPKQWRGYTVIDGDKHDLRFLDPSAQQGLIIGLNAKGDAKKDTSGFVRFVKEKREHAVY